MSTFHTSTIKDKSLTDISVLLAYTQATRIAALYLYFGAVFDTQKTNSFENTFLRSRYENTTPNLCWVFCALLGVLCN